MTSDTKQFVISMSIYNSCFFRFYTCNQTYTCAAFEEFEAQAEN